MKRCAKCSTEKPPTEFHRNSRAKDQLCSYCKACAKEETRKHRLTKPEMRAAVQSAYFARNKAAIYQKRKERMSASEELREKQRQWGRRARLKKTYGLTPCEVEQMSKDQGGCCAMCGRGFGDRLKPVVDHCHSSGKVRSLLCSPCNTALGHFEKPGFAKAAKEYLSKHGAHSGNAQKAG